MAGKKYCIFQVQGGLGKHILSTAVAQVIKRAYPDRELIVVCNFIELWTNLPFVHRVFPLGQTLYFYEEFIQGRDSLVFAQEPYFTTPHINKTHKLVESWCLMYGLEHKGEKPVVKINVEERNAISNFYESKFQGLLPLLIQTNGGPFNAPGKFLWSRDMPIDVAQKISNHFSKTHVTLQVCKPGCPLIDGAWNITEAMQNTELVGLLELSNKRLLIDSCLQHAAAALDRPSTVLWNATSPVIFGHDLHTNIIAKQKPNKPLISSYLFDYQFEANEHEFPYEEEDLKTLYNIDEIIASLESQ